MSATQSYTIHVKAPPEAVWDAITTSEQAERYGYRAPIELELRPGGAYRSLANEGMKAYGSPDVVVDGEVLEAEAPARLVQTWRMLFSDELAAESTRLTWAIEAGEDGVSKLTLTHELDGAPTHAAIVSGAVPEAGGGWPFVLSDLKTLLETGAPLTP